MKKRILALFLCLLMAFSLVACGGGGDPSTDSGTTSESSAGSNTDTEDQSTVQYSVWEPSLEHKIIACDIRNHSIVVFDLNTCDGNMKNLTKDAAVVWEWDADEDARCKNPTKISYSISGVRYRYSEYYKKDVVVACANFGWVGIIDYEACKLLWESTDPTLEGAHSVELLPNGDVVVGVSGKSGKVAYFSVASGKKNAISYVSSPQNHGVFWDPEKQCIWALENDGAFKVVVENMGENAKLVRKNALMATFSGDGGGHAFAPVAGEPGKYWASGGRALWIFDTKTMKMTKSASFQSGAIKGNCSFADGTVVQAIAGLGNTKYSFGSNGFRIYTKKMVTSGNTESPKYSSVDVTFLDREFYKVQTFTKNYQ